MIIHFINYECVFLFFAAVSCELLDSMMINDDEIRTGNDDDDDDDHW